MKSTIPGSITAEALRYNSDSPNVYNGVLFTHWPYATIKPSDDRVIVMPYTIEVQIPDNFDVRPGLIANLQEQERKALADFQNLVTGIRRQIAELEALEMS